MYINVNLSKNFKNNNEYIEMNNINKELVEYKITYDDYQNCEEIFKKYINYYNQINTFKKYIDV